MIDDKKGGQLAEARRFMDAVIAGKIDPDVIRRLLTKAEYYGRTKSRLTMTGDATVRRTNPIIIPGQNPHGM